MTREELKQEFDRMNLPKYLYSLYDDQIDDRMVIYHNYFRWEVFYYERGKRVNEKVFRSEDEACRYLLEFFINAQSDARRDGINGYGV